MKLIDGKAFADEILGEIFERGQASGIWEEQLEIGAITYKDIEFANGYDHALDEIYRRIEEQPTVEAIPIEWIEKKITEYIISSRYSSDAVPIVYALLSDWRKENAGILQRD